MRSKTDTFGKIAVKTKPVGSRVAGVHKLLFAGLLAAVIGAAFLAWAMKREPPAAAATPASTPASQLAPKTAGQQPAVPPAEHGNGAMFPPPSNLASGTTAVPSGESAPAPFSGVLGTQPSGVQTLGEAPKPAGKMGSEPANANATLGTPAPPGTRGPGS